jgi:glyoxylase-like metal-dependent hydrolase (beta-lactamase superfamily II)/rhodanese-related sulfurtransferase
MEASKVLETITIDTPAIGNRSYIAHDGGRGLVIDPPRDIDRIEEAAELAQVEIVGVAETHLHNDYVSGGLALARRHGAEYYVAADEQVEFPRTGVRDGDKITLGGIQVEVLATPGHTFRHLAYVATDDASASALFSGGSLLFGTVGRTDLSGAGSTRPLAHRQLASARRLAGRLPRHTGLFPTHGFGSFCAATSAADTSASTLGEQMLANPALRATDADTFVAELVDGFGPVPAHYAHMAALNRRGPTLAAERPDLLTPTELVTATGRGAQVVDLRPRDRFAQGHLPGALNVELSATAAVYTAWLTPWGTPLVLLAETEQQLDIAHRDLTRIGVETVVGVAVAALPESAVVRYERRTWRDYTRSPMPDRVLLDVRNPDETHAGHVSGAVTIPVHELAARVCEVPPGQVWVHCRSGARAALAASALHARGRDVVLLDDPWERAAGAGLPVMSGI